MSEPRRSTRARAREVAGPPAPETPKETPVKGVKASLKRKRTSIVVKDSAPATPVADGAPLPPRLTLPLRIIEGQPLPTLPDPQPLDLPTSEWQNIQQSGVLEASLERSKAVWMSGVNFRMFHRNFVQPKKVAERTDEDKAKMQRQRELTRNFPQLGDIAQLVIEPHTFPIKLFAPRETFKTAQKKPTAPTYGPWPNHSQQSQPNQYPQYPSGPPPYQQPAPRPPPPKPVQRAPPPVAASGPAPDPVIHMLAARAGTDPQLKAVMRVVAAGEASKEQLEFFQTHINELTAILERQKEEAAKSRKALPATSAPKALPPPSPKPLPTLPAPKAIAVPPSPRPVQPLQQQLPKHAAKPYNPTPPQSQMQHMSPAPYPNPPYTNNHPQQMQYHQPQPAPYHSQPQKTTYRPLVFEFVDGNNSGSKDKDNNDKLHFPSYSFIEWLPNGSGYKISFLITRMKPKPEPTVKPPSTPAPQAVLAVKPPSTPAPKPGQTPAPGVVSIKTHSAVPDFLDDIPTPGTAGPLPQAISTPPAPAVAPPRIEDFDEKDDIADIDFYQPVTVLLLTENRDIVETIIRAVRPPDVVEKYMNEVFDKCRRADETYLAFRLPKDGDTDGAEKRVRSGDVTPAVATPTHDMSFGGIGMGISMGAPARRAAGRPRKSLV